MVISIELPPEEERTLLEWARGSGRDPASYIRNVLLDHFRDVGESGIEDLIDHEAVAACARDVDDSITLEEVRAATSKIDDSMARVVIEEERGERT